MDERVVQHTATLAVVAVLNGHWRIGYALGEGSFERVCGVTDLLNMAAGTLQYIIKLTTRAHMPGAHTAQITKTLLITRAKRTL